MSKHLKLATTWRAAPADAPSRAAAHPLASGKAGTYSRHMGETATVYRWRIKWRGQWRTTRQHYLEESIRAYHPEAIRIEATWRVLPVTNVPPFPTDHSNSDAGPDATPDATATPALLAVA